MIVSRRRYMGSSAAPPIPYEEQYLTFKALESGTFTLTIPSGMTTSNLSSVSYSLDGGSTWTTTNNADDTEVVITTPSVAANDKVLWKGTALTFGEASNSASCKFSSTGNFTIYGNSMSLLYGDDFLDKISFPSSSRIFAHLFNGCSKLSDAINFILPATTLSKYCYSFLFKDTGIVSAPVLPALTLANYCYANMFYGCSSLKYIKCLATSISATGVTNNWLQYASSTGTFVKDANTTWSTGLSGIPSGWTIIDA